jgi:predicted dehydrogenase
MESLRFGLVGTGYWARIVHAPALASTEGIELSAIWGRDPAAAQVLAAQHGATALADFDEFLSRVDAVGFAVPPDVQSALAVRAAKAGKHLLLEKPIALTVAEADTVVAAVQQAAVASVVFFTAQFQADVRGWLESVTAQGGWAGGSALWLGSALQHGSPFNTPWRRDKGGLWDLGPHLVALLWRALGPVVSVTADAGADGVTHLVLHHHSGVTSGLTISMDVPENAEVLDVQLFGPRGRSAAPREAGDAVVPLRTALTELTASARAAAESGTQPAHRVDAAFGRDIVRVLEEAQRQLDG